MAVYDDKLNMKDVEDSTFRVLCKNNTKDKTLHKTMQEFIDSIL